jgi:hypothetical protein
MDAALQWKAAHPVPRWTGMTITALDQSWFPDPATAPRRRVALLDADPGFARGVPAEDLALARRQLVVAVENVPRGRWRVDPGAPGRPLAYVVLAGSLIRDRRVEDRWSTELLGPEDVLQPWDEPLPPDGLSMETAWTVVQPLRIALLDRRFALAGARWPQLLDQLVTRALRRARLLATLLSVSKIRRLDERLLVLLRLLADRWGYVAADGIHMRLPLTHETIARLAGAQRPSVSTALSRLAREGLVVRRGRQLVLPLELEAEAATARSALAGLRSASAPLGLVGPASRARCGDGARPSLH